MNAPSYNFIESHGRQRRVWTVPTNYVPSHCVHCILMERYCRSCAEQWAEVQQK